jgi:hypothetical protein
MSVPFADLPEPTDPPFVLGRLVAGQATGVVRFETVIEVPRPPA